MVSIPYFELHQTNIQPYDVTTEVHEGDNEVKVEVSDLGIHHAVSVDGLFRSQRKIRISRLRRDLGGDERRQARSTSTCVASNLDLSIRGAILRGPICGAGPIHCPVRTGWRTP